jgi:selenocysteine lyase/cysteine desulfurase
MADIDNLAKICEQNGIYLILDAVQSVGIRKINLKKLRVAFLVCGGQKYLRAGTGIGFMYVNKDIFGNLRDTKVGIRSMKGFDDNSYTLKDTAERLQDGTQNLSGIVALHASLKHINSIGIENIEKQNIQLLRKIKACLTLYGIPFIDHGDRQSNIVSMQVDDPQGLFEFLRDRSIYIKPIKDVARLSFIHESKMEDIEALAKYTREWLNAKNKLESKEPLVKSI